MKHASLFTGIEGFGNAADAMGWQTVFHCEKEQRLLKMLQYYYPNADSYGDITTTDFKKYRGTIDVLSGGFPCQPYSSAGQRKGTDDERHLWPEMLRAIREIQPKWVVGENVRGIISWNAGMVFEQVQADLEAEGYEVQTFLLPASGVDAPHERYRTWFVAYTNMYDGRLLSGYETRLGRENEKHTFASNTYGNEYASNTNSNRNERIASACTGKNQNKAKWTDFFEQTIGFSRERTSTNTNGSGLRNESNGTGEPKFADKVGQRSYWENFPTQSPICNGNDGIPTESLRSFILHNSGGVLTEKEVEQILSKTITAARNEAIKAGGNAIVPQVALQIFKAIDQYSNY